MIARTNQLRHPMLLMGVEDALRRENARLDLYEPDGLAGPELFFLEDPQFFDGRRLRGTFELLLPLGLAALKPLDFLGLRKVEAGEHNRSDARGQQAPTSANSYLSRRKLLHRAAKARPFRVPYQPLTAATTAHT